MRSLAILLLLQVPTPPIGAARSGTTPTPPPIREAIIVPLDAATPVDPAAMTTTAGALAIATPVPVDGRTIVAPEPGAERNLEPPGWSGATGTVLSNPDAGFKTLSPLRKAWFVREYHRVRGDAVSAKKALDTLVDVRLDSGIENATAISAALVREARTHVKEKRPPEAIEVAEAAAKLSPDWPQAWMGLARSQLAAGKWGDVFASVKSAAAAVTRNQRVRVRMLANASASLALGILVAWLIFLLSVYLRHGRFLVHDFKHALADKMPTFVAAVIIVPFLAFPVVFGLGPLPLAAWLTLAIWLKLTTKERAVAAIFLLVGAATPILLARGSEWLAFESGMAGRLHAALREDELTGRALGELSAEAHETGDPDALLTVALAHQRAGRYSAAEASFTLASEKGAGAAALVGRGVARYGMGDVAAAIGAFEKAVAIDARNLAAHYNLARIYNERAELDKYKVEWATATSIDAAKCQAMVPLPPQRKPANDVASGLPLNSAPWVNRFLMLETPSDARLAARAREGAGAIAQKTWRRLSPAIPLGATSFVFLGLLTVAGVLTGAFRDVTPSRPCPRCGRGLCLRCDGPPLESDFCVQCYHAFIDTEGVDPKQRMLKEREVRMHADRHQRNRKLLSFVLPGAGHLFGGNTVRGAIVIFLAGIALARLLLWRGWLRPVFPDGPDLPLLAIALSGLVLLYAWILGVRGHEEGGR